MSPDDEGRLHSAPATTTDHSAPDHTPPAVAAVPYSKCGCGRRFPSVEQERRRPVRRFPWKGLAMLADAYIRRSRVWDTIAAEVAERDRKERS